MERRQYRWMAGAGEDESEGGAKVAELVEEDGVADDVVTEGDSGELEAVELCTKTWAPRSWLPNPGC